MFYFHLIYLFSFLKKPPAVDSAFKNETKCFFLSCEYFQLHVYKLLSTAGARTCMFAIAQFKVLTVCFGVFLP